MNMKPEEKVVSLETARKLKEAGFPQDTEHSWGKVRSHSGDKGEGKIDLSTENDRCMGEEYSNVYSELVSAPDAQEVELPTRLTYKNRVGETVDGFIRISFHVGSTPDDQGVRYCEIGYFAEPDVIDFRHCEVNEAEARASAWLFLRGEGLC